MFHRPVGPVEAAWPVSLPSDEWRGMGKEVSHTPGIPWQRFCQRPPRRLVDEMTGHILILTPQGQKTERVLGELGFRWHVSLYFGICSICLLGYVSTHFAIYIHCTAMGLESESRGSKYSRKAYLYDFIKTRKIRSRETVSVMDDRQISIWAGGGNF